MFQSVAHLVVISYAAEKSGKIKVTSKILHHMNPEKLLSNM